MNLTYNPYDHYWKRNTGWIYSSKRRIEVEVYDKEYLNWCNTGKIASRYPLNSQGYESPEELQKILAPFGIETYFPDFEESKKRKFAELFTKYQQAFELINLIYPSAEREGWTIQEAEAERILSNPEATNYNEIAPVLTMLIKYRNKKEKIVQLAQKVIENAQMYRSLYAIYTGQQQRMYQEITNIANQVELDAYEINFVTPEEIMNAFLV